MSGTSLKSRPPDEVKAVAKRVKTAVERLYGSQKTARRAWGLETQSAVSKQLNDSGLPSSWVFAELAAAGADVMELLTGVPRPAAAPLFEELLPGSPGGYVGRAIGWYPLPPELAGAAALYAVRVDEALAAATLGGEVAARPRPGDTLIVAADPEVAKAFAAELAVPETPILKTIPPTPRRSLLLLPPPIVLVGEIPVLSLAHRVTLFDPGEPPGKHTLRLLAEPIEPAAASEADPIGRTLDVVGYALWRSGPLRPC